MRRLNRASDECFRINLELDPSVTYGSTEVLFEPVKQKL